jgi:single-stranded-DNA-specific exonuclease
MRTRVAGVTFEGRQEIIKQCKVGDRIWLEPEPDNQYDPNAVKVMVETSLMQEVIGYIPRRESERVSYYAEDKFYKDGLYPTGTIIEIHGGEGMYVGVTIEFDMPEGD